MSVMKRTEGLSVVNNTTQPAGARDAAYQLLFDKSPVAMLLYDKETLRLIAANDSAVNLYGYTREELLDMTAPDLDAKESAGALQGFSSGGDRSEGRANWKHRRKDGSTIDVQTVAVALPFGDRLTRLVVVEDVTERKAAEQQALQAQDLLNALLDNSPDNIYFKDVHSRFIKMSSSVSNKFGLRDPSEAVGKSDFDFFSEESARDFYLAEQQVMKSGQPLVNVEEKEVHSDGRETWASTTAMPLRDRRGQIVGTFGITRDITALKQAQDELVRERDLLHTLMDNIPDLIYFKTADGRFTRINKAQASVLGLSDPADAVGKSDFDFFTAEFANFAHDDEQRIVSTGLPLLSKTELLRTKNGSTRWMLATKVPIKDGEGRVAGLVGISKDITERKEAEEKLNRGLAEFLNVVSVVSEGDLTKRGEEGDDTLGRIARSINKMLDSFDRMLKQVKQLGLMVSSSAMQILSASEQMSEGAQRQANEITITSASVEEMAASMNQVSVNTETTSRAANLALDRAQQGGTAVQDTSDAILRIDSAVGQTAEKMRLLKESSSEITEILSLIDEIASQTNLLSLNAAIEAAHAGDAGLGFSVVAEEIRKLADRCAQATRGIRKIVQSIQTETAEALAAMKACTGEVKDTRLLSDQAQQMLLDIASAVKESAVLIGDISAASEEQAKVSTAMATTMNTISDIAVETSAGAHQTSQVVQGLVSISDQLNEAIGKFRVS